MLKAISVEEFLHACTINNVTAVKCYLAQNSNVNVANDLDRTALHLAVAAPACNVAILQHQENVPALLIQANAEVPQTRLV